MKLGLTGFFRVLCCLLSCIAYAWVALSVNTSTAIPEGDDQIVQILAFILVPVSIVDNRLNHWHHPRPISRWCEAIGAIGILSLIVAKIQGFALYMHSSLGKLGSPTWVDGTEVYYDMHSPMFGPSYLLAEFGQWATSFPLITQGLTWGIIALEFFLAIMSLTSLKIRLPLLISGVTLHVSFGLFLGLWGFAFAMIGLLMLHGAPLRSAAYSLSHFSLRLTQIFNPSFSSDLIGELSRPKSLLQVEAL